MRGAGHPFWRPSAHDRSRTGLAARTQVARTQVGEHTRSDWCSSCAETEGNLSAEHVRTGQVEHSLGDIQGPVKWVGGGSPAGDHSPARSREYVLRRVSPEHKA